MATENTEKKPSQEELLKTVADVLDEALAVYEDAFGAAKLEKGAERPHVSSKMDEGLDAAMACQNALGVTAKPVSTPGIGDGSTTGIMAKDEDKGKDKDKKDKDDMDKSDADLVNMYKSLISKMEARGLIKKAENTSASIQKSETAQSQNFDAVKAQIENDLRKSMDERFESMATAIKGVAETVKKIAAVPQGRKGLTGYQPLKKNEGQAPLRKGEVIGKLLELRKSGDQRVDSLFITRIEQGRLMKGDDERLKSLGISGE